jgi:aspartate kinase
MSRSVSSDAVGAVLAVINVENSLWGYDFLTKALCLPNASRHNLKLFANSRRARKDLSMIVMKFGGSSLESGPAIRRVTGIVKSQLASQPLVVVSAMGDTTDILLELAREAERGHSYQAWKGLKELREYHSETAASVSHGGSLQNLDDLLHKYFNSLHRIFVTMEDEGRELTPELRDEIASYGERLSSEVVASALECAGVPSICLDSRQLILTSDQFTHAEPLYWETCAKLRRVIPRASRNRTAVMAGFIGATRTGATTTLGRGGSDLTASIAGAAICADEIQFWKDVDGMLTCSPKLLDGAYRIKSISYREAAAMAQAGAEVLHPETIAPAERQRIPIVVRNSRRPGAEGTRIVSSALPCRNLFKSIAAKQDVTLLEVRLKEDAGNFLEDLLCGRHGVSPELIACSDGAAYLGLRSSDCHDTLQLDMKGCVEVRLHTGRAVLTLVGSQEPASQFSARALVALKNPDAFVVSGPHARFALTVVVPQQDLHKSVEALHREFFAQVDPGMFAKVERQVEAVRGAKSPSPERALVGRPSVIRIQPVLAHS